MTEKASEGPRVSLDKPAAPVATQPAAAPAERPKQALWLVAAVLLSGVLALVASLSLLGLHSFIVSEFVKSNRKLKASDRRSHAAVLQSAHQQPIAVLVQSAIFLVVVVVVARAVWRGRYWSRWAVIGVWALATFTGIFGGAPGVLYIAQSAPLALKVPVVLSSLAFIVAVLLAFFSKPLVAWLNLTRPARPAAGTGAPARRGLFTPREPIRPAAARAVSRPPDGSSAERSRAKQRASGDATQREAAEVRARARGSKSRRNGS